MPPLGNRWRIYDATLTLKVAYLVESRSQNRINKTTSQTNGSKILADELSIIGCIAKQSVIALGCNYH